MKLCLKLDENLLSFLTIVGIELLQHHKRSNVRLPFADLVFFPFGRTNIFWAYHWGSNRHCWRKWRTIPCAGDNCWWAGIPPCLISNNTWLATCMQNHMHKVKTKMPILWRQDPVIYFGIPCFHVLLNVYLNGIFLTTIVEARETSASSIIKFVKQLIEKTINIKIKIITESLFYWS